MFISPISINSNYKFNTYQKTQPKQIQNSINEFSKTYAESAKMQALSSVSFTGKSKPVYLIDEKLNCTFHKKQLELVDIVNATPQRISGCLNGRNNLVNGFVVVYPHEVEVEQEDGTVVTPKSKVAEIYQRRLEPNAVYTIDYKGNHTKYLAKNHIPSTAGLVIVDASEVEKFDEDGKMYVDKKKISTTLLEDDSYAAVYTKDKEGKLDKHESQASLAKKLGVTGAAIYSAIHNISKINGEFNVIPASEIEVILPDGTIGTDDTKLEKFLSRKVSNKRACYVASRNLEDLQYKRYESRKDMASANRINYDTFSKRPKLTTSNGDFIIKASDVEVLNENGEWVLSPDKLKEAIKAKIREEQLELQENAVYTIDINYKEQRHDDIDAVAVALNRSRDTVYSALYYDGIHKKVADKIVVKASEIEIIDENGKVSVDRKKISQLVRERFGDKMVYLIDQKGEWKKYRNRFSMAIDQGASSPLSTSTRLNGFVIVDASLVEDFDEDEIPFVNREKVMQFAKKSKASFEVVNV